MKLPDSFKGQLFSLHKNPHRLVYELLGNLKNLRGHCSRENTHLDSFWQKLENLIDLQARKQFRNTSFGYKNSYENKDKS